MFSFLGLSADPVDGLSEQLPKTWPELDVVKIARPISAIGIRFGQDLYEESDEGIPKNISCSVDKLSTDFPAARFLLLRTECWGGICQNWGQVIQNGKTAFQASGEGALRRLMAHWGIDLGPREIFEPLRRDFRWHS